MSFLLQEKRMRNWSSAAVTIIVGVALYFASAWGIEAVGMLASPAYGLDDVWRSQVFFAIGHFFGLAPIGMIKLAAFFATLKLSVAIICAVHIFSRARALFSGKADTDILEAGLILIVVISIALVGPAVWAKNVALVREATFQLLLATVATALCMVERARRNDEAATGELVAAQGASWFTRWR
jgi:hypothetical protein